MDHPNHRHENQRSDGRDQNVCDVRRDWEAETVQADGAEQIQIENRNQIEQPAERLRELDVQRPWHRCDKLVSGHDDLDGTEIESLLPDFFPTLWLKFCETLPIQKQA